MIGALHNCRIALIFFVNDLEFFELQFEKDF